MEKLNLPAAELEIFNDGEAVLVYDIIRKKNVVLTPEEWVRQHFVHFAVDHLGYPKSLVKIESGHTKNTMMRRTDIVLYNNQGSPAVLIECKNSKEPLNQKAVNQAIRYNSVLKAPFVIITNGVKNYCCFYNQKERFYEFIDSIPSYKAL